MVVSPRWFSDDQVSRVLLEAGESVFSMAGRRAGLPRASLLLLVLLMTRPVLACWPDYVEQGAEQADVVVMAKVIHLGSSRGHGLNSFYNLVRIQVKTFLKGEEACRKHVRRLPVARDRPEREKGATFVEAPDPPSRPPSDPPLGVDGVSARGTCSGRVRVGDIMIFFLRLKTPAEVREGRSAEATFHVTSQPIKLNLQLLRYTQTAVQGEYAVVLCCRLSLVCCVLLGCGATLCLAV